MINPPISELIKKVDSKFTLCVAVAKRARQLTAGPADAFVKYISEKPVTIAANEINEGKLIYSRTKEIINNKIKIIKKSRSLYD